VNPTEALKTIQQVVDRQAEDELLWSIPAETPQSIGEAHLQRELRYLHGVIEGLTGKETTE